MAKDFGPGSRLLVSPGYTPLTLLRANDVEFVDVDRLGLSPDLADEVAAWAESFESLGWDPRTQEHLPHEHVARGWALARRVALEVGPGLPVFWGDQLALDARAPG
ncbi:hypothetical protein GCM10027418_01250 [Mariniluteicoccus endophyticus]